MNLKIFNFETVLNLNDNIISVIEVEDTHLFRKIIETIQYQMKNQDVEEKVYIYDDEFNEISYRKIEMIFNYIDLFSNIKMTKEISNLLNNELDHETESAIQNINIELNEFATKVLYNLDIDLDYKNSFQLTDLLRILKVKINDNGSILDNLFSLIDFYSLMAPNKFLFFVNLKIYLDTDEIIEFYNYIRANKLTAILLEGRASDKILKNEQKLHIDSTFDDHYRLQDS